jgi:hypothetical protein
MQSVLVKKVPPVLQVLGVNFRNRKINFKFGFADFEV